MQLGSKGSPGGAELEYWHPLLHAPYGIYHSAYLGTAKNITDFWKERLKDSPVARQQRTLLVPFKYPGALNKVVQLRLRQFVMRSATKCAVVNVVEHPHAMTIAEMQLFFEVAVPYVMHEWLQLGVPEAVVFSGCGFSGHLLLRHLALYAICSCTTSAPATCAFATCALCVLCALCATDAWHCIVQAAHQAGPALPHEVAGSKHAGRVPPDYARWPGLDVCGHGAATDHMRGRLQRPHGH